LSLLKKENMFSMVNWVLSQLMRCGGIELKRGIEF